MRLCLIFSFYTYTRNFSLIVFVLFNLICLLCCVVIYKYNYLCFSLAGVGCPRPPRPRSTWMGAPSTTPPSLWRIHTYFTDEGGGGRGLYSPTLCPPPPAASATHTSVCRLPHSPWASSAGHMGVKAKTHADQQKQKRNPLMR